MIEQKILDAFETMWGPFPEPVMLIHRDRTILPETNLRVRRAFLRTLNVSRSTLRR